MFQKTVGQYAISLHLWLSLTALHLFVRLVTVAVIVPLTGTLLAVTLSFSDQSALTDQDIARFLLTPAGALGAIVVGSLIIVAAVVDIAVMTKILRLDDTGVRRSLSAAVHFLLRSLPIMFRFASLLLVRVLLISLPFLGIAAAAAAVLLGEFDINYYLSYQPPEFLMTIAIAGLSGCALAIFLVKRLVNWAVALHLCVFTGVSVAAAFRLSHEYMAGHRWSLILSLIWWVLIRIAAFSLVFTATGFLLAEVPSLADDNPRIFFLVTALIVVIWAMSNTAVTAVSNGALAGLLNDVFNRCSEGRVTPTEDGNLSASAGQKAVLAVAVVASLCSLLAGGVLSNRFGGVQDVAVIAHRGASGSRPENTMSAVIKAIEDGADWVEIDVQESADGDVLVVHDSDFMKAAGVATKVWDISTDEVAKIDIGSWFDPIYAEERTPLLAEVLEVVRGHSKLLIEFKYYGHDEDLENRVIGLVEAAGMQDQIATMSLKYPAVQKMKRLRPSWRAGVLAATSVGDLAGLQGEFLAVSAGQAAPRLIVRAAAADKDVYVWTVNDATSMSRMISLGVDGLITDEPLLARQVIAHYSALSTPERLMLRLADRVGFAFDFASEL